MRKIYSTLAILLSLWIGAPNGNASLPLLPSNSSLPEWMPGELIVRFKTRPAFPKGKSSKILAADLVAGLTPTSVKLLHHRYQLIDLQPLLASEWDANSKQTASSSSHRRKMLDRQQRAPLHGEIRAAQLREKFDRTFLLRFESHTPLAEIREAYRQDPNVESVDYNRLYIPFVAPNDPYYASSRSWNQPYRDLWGLEKVEAEKAWDISTGEGVIVAVIDSGIDPAHSDIRENLWKYPGWSGGNDYLGYDIVNKSHEERFFRDTLGHGTHVAGTIAAIGNNGNGIIGLAHKSQIMVIDVFFTISGQFTTTAFYLKQALIYATDQGADVVNMSLGGPPGSETEEEGIAYAYNHGVVLVAASGNGNTRGEAMNLGQSPIYPASWPQVITVGASTIDDEAANFSNYGEKLDVIAPGGNSPAYPADDKADNILSLNSPYGAIGNQLRHLRVGSDSRYLRLAGTSMAAPHVTGLAALLLSAKPSLNVEEVRQIIRSTADDVGAPGFDIRTGYGRINAWKALESLGTSSSSIQTKILQPTDHAEVVGATPIYGTVTGTRLKEYVLEFLVHSSTFNWISLGSGNRPVTNQKLGIFDSDGKVQDGTYTIRLRAVDLDGHETQDQIHLTKKTVLEESRIFISTPSSNTNVTEEEDVLICAKPHALPAIQSVQFFIDSQKIATDDTLENNVYCATWTALGLGIHQVNVEAVETTRRIPSESISLQVDPAIRISKPLSNAVLFNFMPVSLEVLVRPVPGKWAPEKVKFFRDDVLLGEGNAGAGTTVPQVYSLLWTPSSPGASQITVKASNPVGQIKTDGPIPVFIQQRITRPFIAASKQEPEELTTDGQLHVEAQNAEKIRWRISRAFSPKIPTIQELEPPLFETITGRTKLPLAPYNLTPGYYLVEASALDEADQESESLLFVIRLHAIKSKKEAQKQSNF